MIHLFNDVFLLRHFHRLGDHGLDVILVVTYELLGPQIFEVLLDLREGQLDGIVPFKTLWINR